MKMFEVMKSSNKEYINIDFIFFQLFSIRIEIDYAFAYGLKFGSYLVLNDRRTFNNVIYNGLKLSLLNANIVIFSLKEIK